MEKTKVFRLLQTFSKEEWKRFDKFLRSPYHNESAKLYELFQLLRSTLSKEISPQREVIWADLMPGPFNLNNWKQLLHKFLGLQEQFIILESTPPLAWPRPLTYLQSLRARKLDKLYQQQLTRIQKAENASPLRDVEYHFHQYELRSEANQFYASDRTKANNLDLVGKSFMLDLWYLAQRLSNLAEVLNLQRILGPETAPTPDPETTRFLLAQAESPEVANIPMIHLVAQAIHTLLEPDADTYYFALKDGLAESADQFSRVKARGLYTFAQNYCIRKINQGIPGFLQELFDLNLALLDKELLLEDGFLSPWHYKNIVITGLRLGEYEWVETFIESAKSSLPPALRKNAYTYNLAKLSYYRKDFKRVLRLLQAVEYEDLFYLLDAKAMLLKVYYERDEIEALEALLHSFQVYLNRNRSLSESHRQNYLNLIRFVRALNKLDPGDTAQRAQWLKTVRATQQVADRAWLLAQVE